MIKWKRGEDFTVESHCGKYTISPVWWGRVQPAEYELITPDGLLCSPKFETQKDAKKYVFRNFE